MKKLVLVCVLFVALLLWQAQEQPAEAQPAPFECPWTPVKGPAPFAKGCFGGGVDGCGGVVPGKCSEGWPEEPDEAKPDASTAVSIAIARLKAAGENLKGKNCGKVVEVACSIMGEDAGLMTKPFGNQYNGHAVDIIAFPDGYIYNVVADCDKGTGGRPIMELSCCGPSKAQGGKGTCPAKYMPCICTLGALCDPQQ